MTEAMTLAQILILALVQGVTEFLPISSSAHLILANRLLGFSDEGVVFDVAVHLGSLLAVMVYFRRDLTAMVTGTGTTQFVQFPPRRLMLWLALATVPLGLVGLIYARDIAEHLRSNTVIAWACIVFGLALWAADVMARRIPAAGPLRPAHLLAMGLAQVLALIPGASRAGVTMTAGLALGLTRQQAARASFMLAIPAIGAAGVYGIAEMLQHRPLPWDQFAVAVSASFLGAWACIHAFLKLVDRIGLLPFVVYRLALGGLLLAV